MSTNGKVVASVSLVILSVVMGVLGAPLLAAILLCVAIGISAYIGLGSVGKHEEVHYHFHGDKEEVTEQFKSVTQATEQSVEMPDGRVARVRKVTQWQ